MAKKVIQNGEEIYSNGVRLIRDTTNNGGWIVAEFVDDSFHNGLEVHSTQIDVDKMEYWVDDEEYGDHDHDTRDHECADKYPGNMGEENSAPR